MEPGVGPTVTDGFVLLSPLTLDDVDDHFAGEDDELVRWLSEGRATRDGVAAYIRQTIDNWRTGAPIRNFGIRVGTPPVLAGTMDVQFNQSYLQSGQVNLAYGLYPHWRGKGIASAAIVLACRYSKAHGATEAVVRVDAENVASAAVATRNGFQWIKRATSSEDKKPMDWYVRSLTDLDPLPRTNRAVER